MKFKKFELYFADKWVNKNDIIETNDSINLIVLSKPNRKWYHLLLQYITFNLYKAKFSYTVKIKT